MCLDNGSLWEILLISASYPVGTGVISSEVKQQGHEARGMLQGAWRDEREQLVSFWLIIWALCCLHKKYQSIWHYTSIKKINTHISTYQYILPASASKCQNENENDI
jgi:hypothetical protein